MRSATSARQGHGMGQRGQHVLIVDDHAQRRRVIDYPSIRAGYRGAIARNLDEAAAVLRPALHPLIAHISVPPGRESVWNGSPLIELISSPAFAATHAIIVVWRGGATLNADVREQVANLGVGYVQWVEMPVVSMELECAYAEAVRCLASRG